MNASFGLPISAPETPDSGLFPISNLSARARVDQSDLFWSRPMHHRLLIPTLSSPKRSPRDDDTEEDSSVESFANIAPPLSLKQRWNPFVRNAAIVSPFLELTPLPSPPQATKEPTLASEQECLNESFPLSESTWCLSDPDYQSHDNDDASLDDCSIDEEVQELTLMSYQLRPVRPTPSKGFGGDFPPVTTLLTHIVVLED